MKNTPRHDNPKMVKIIYSTMLGFALKFIVLFGIKDDTAEINGKLLGICPVNAKNSDQEKHAASQSKANAKQEKTLSLCKSLRAHNAGNAVDQRIDSR